MGFRVLARVRPERALFEGVAAPALALLRVEPGAIGGGAKASFASFRSPTEIMPP